MEDNEQEEEEEGDLFQTLTRLKERCLTLLAATQADWKQDRQHVEVPALPRVGRHRKNPSDVCIVVTLHEEFKVWEKHCLETGEDLGMLFSQIIKQMFPESSEKGSKEQCRLPTRKSKWEPWKLAWL